MVTSSCRARAAVYKAVTKSCLAIVIKGYFTITDMDCLNIPSKTEFFSFPIITGYLNIAVLTSQLTIAAQKSISKFNKQIKLV